MFKIDQRTPYASFQQFATQVVSIPPELKAVFDANFGGEESGEFYQGLLTGLANAQVLSGTGFPDAPKILACLVAYVADKIARRG